MTTRLLTIPQVAEIRGCHVDTVRRAIKAKRLLAARPTPNGPYVIRPEWLDKWIDDSIVEPEIQPPRSSPARPPRPARRGSLRHLERELEEGAA